MRHRLPQHRNSPWDDLSPSKHMLLGMGLVVLAIPIIILACIITVWFFLTIGILQTLTMYLALTFITIMTLMYTRHRRHGIGFRTVQCWDTDAADQSGSTARYGIPHDPYSFFPQQSLTGKRRNPPKPENLDDSGAV